MLITPNCFKRKCKHYDGVILLREGDESSEVNVCRAFPEGIPFDIAYGNDLHAEVHHEQDDELATVYEPVK